MAERTRAGKREKRSINRKAQAQTSDHETSSQQADYASFNELSSTLEDDNRRNLKPDQIISLQRAVGNRGTRDYINRSTTDNTPARMIQRDPTKTVTPSTSTKKTTPAKVTADTALIYPRGELDHPDSLLHGIKVANAPLVSGDMISVHEDKTFRSRRSGSDSKATDKDRADDDRTVWFRATAYRWGEEHDGYICGGTFDLKQGSQKALVQDKSLDQAEAAKQERQPALPEATPNAEFNLPDLTFAGLSFFFGKLLNLDKVGVGAINTELKFKGGISGGVQEVLELSIMPYINLAASMNVQDDRRLRISGSLGFGVGVDATLVHFLKAYANIGMTFSLAGVYQDTDHFAARVVHQIEGIIAAIRKGLNKYISSRVSRAKQLTPEEIKKLKAQKEKLGHGEDYGELRYIEPAAVTSRSLDAGGGASVADTVGFDATVSSAKQNFYKNTDKGKMMKEGKTTTHSFSVWVKVPGLFNATVGITRSVIINNSNPDNNGDYLNLKITPGTAVPFGEDFLAKLAENIPSTKGFSPDTIGNIIKDNMASAAESSNLLESISKPPEGNISLEFNFVSSHNPDTPETKTFLKQLFDGDYTLQYARISTSTSISAAQDASVPIMPGLNAKFGLSGKLERNSALFEIAASNTNTYIQTIYDGLLNRGRRGRKQWDSYRKNNQETLEAIILAAKNDKKAVHSEVASLDYSAVDDGSETFKRAKAFMDYAASGKWNGVKINTRVPASLLAAYESYMEAVRLANIKDDAKKWIKVGTAAVIAHVYVNENGGINQITAEGKNKEPLPSDLEDAFASGKTINLKIRKVGSKKTLTKFKYGGGRSLQDAVDEFTNTKKFHRGRTGVHMLDATMYLKYKKLFDRWLAAELMNSRDDNLDQEFKDFNDELVQKIPALISNIEQMPFVDKRKQ